MKQTKLGDSAWRSVDGAPSTIALAPRHRAAAASLLGATLLGGVTLGCAGGGLEAKSAPAHAVATTQTTAARIPVPAHAELSTAVRDEDDDADDDPRGTLVIQSDVVATCGGLRAMQSGIHAGEREDTMAWLAMLKSIASCMNGGELQSRHIVLRGAARSQAIVKYIFSRLGVAEGRVDLTEDAGPACLDDCDAAERRVEIGLDAGARGAGASSTFAQSL